MNDCYAPLQGLNHARIADDVVLMLRTREMHDENCSEALRRGSELCDFLLRLLHDTSSEECSDYWRKLSAEYKMSLQEVNHGELKFLKELTIARDKLAELSSKPRTISPEEIVQVQKVLTLATMPLWKLRTSEFWDRKLKRGLLSHG
jgi:hypothetical protein